MTEYAVVPLVALGDSLVTALDSPGFAPLALVTAVCAGALHAVAPGHGKTLTAGYLVADGARRRDAVLLAAVVAAMHTVSVVAVALAWLWLSTSAVVDLGPVAGGLKIAAALMVLLAGLLLVLRHRRHLGHAHGHHHHHAAGPSRPGLALIAASGGLLPSPTALMLLLTGMFSGRAGLALALVACFGIGMALVLGGFGVATLAGRDVLLRLSTAGAAVRVARALPVVVAWGIVAAGCVLTTAAVAGA